jgi:hypothetical protein
VACSPSPDPQSRHEKSAFQLGIAWQLHGMGMGTGGGNQQTTKFFYNGQSLKTKFYNE